MSANNADSFTWPAHFSCVLILEDALFPVDYTLTVDMTPDVAQATSTSIGLKKIKEFITRFVDNAIVISQYHSFLSQLQKLKTNTVELPQDPNDYLFASILFQKLNSIAYDYFSIKKITVDSSIGDHVQYTVNSSSNTYKEILDRNEWWKQDNVKTNNYNQFPSWEDLNIMVSTRFSPKIVKGGRDENKPI
jgi:hypothetical protein